MSRVSLLEKLYVKHKSALEFNYDALMAPPILSIMSIEDINQLYKIATSLKYNGNMDKKYQLIDEVMVRRGFRKAHCGTNRVVYNFLELPTFVAKVALDRVGMSDSPAEFKNQEFFKPFCCKIFEVDPTGVLAFVERVNPISSKEEFLSVADDIFNLLITKVIGKYVVDDLGSDTYMNFGVRQLSAGCTFGPVIIDYPYAYELDGAKLICARDIDTPLGKIRCGGEIDYDAGFNHLVCGRCGKTYTAMDLKKKDCKILMFGGNKEGLQNMRAKVVSGDKVILDSGRSSETYISKDEYSSISNGQIEPGKVYAVSKTSKTKYRPANQKRRDFFTALQKKHFEEEQAKLPNNPIVIANRILSTDYSNEPVDTINSDNIVAVTNVIEANTKDIEQKILPELIQEPVEVSEQEYHDEETKPDETTEGIVEEPVTEPEEAKVKEEIETDKEEISPDMEAFARGFEAELHRNIDKAIADTIVGTDNGNNPDDTEVLKDTNISEATQETDDQSSYLAEQAMALANGLIEAAGEAIEASTEVTEPGQISDETDISELSADIIGSAVEEEEVDYSNYIPPEEETSEEEVDPEDDPKYKDEIDKFNGSKKNKKNGKGPKKPSARNIRKHSSRYENYGEEDMSEY